MPKHHGIVSRSRPSFEYLDERALLSGGLSGSPGTGEVLAPPSSPIPSGSQLPASPGSGGAQGSLVDSAQTPDEPWQFVDRSHFRAFLVKVARNRLIDRRRQHRHALAKEQALAVTAPEDLFRAQEPRPSEIAQGHELWTRMLEQCTPAHREILILKRQGLLLTEIAARTGLHEGSIRPILYDLARRFSIPGRPGPRSSDAIQPRE
jgi:hypothetical protein